MYKLATGLLLTVLVCSPAITGPKRERDRGKEKPTDARDICKDGLLRHLTDWGLATELPSSPMYRPDGYWRGPIWAPSTFIAVDALERCGYTELANDIAERFCKLCNASGFAENFDALDGSPLCDRAYTWTSSVFLLLSKRFQD